MTHKKKFVRNTKTIYYAIVQKLEVPVDATEKEIDDIVCQQLTEPADYMWSDEPDLFDLEKYC
jgi:hypothetical protein